MSYRRKHFGYGKYAPVALLAFTLATQGCKDGNSSTEKDKIEKQGLLDPTPEVVRDKYGSNVKLTQVELPVYERDGKIKENYGILTRGQNPEHFAKYDIGELNVRKVYFNNSHDACYVMVGKYGEITDINGHWVGLVADMQGRVVPLAADNVDQYRLEYDQTLNGTSNPRRNLQQVAEKEVAWKAPVDSVKIDSLSNYNDSVNKVDSIVQVIDTIAKINTYE